MDKSNVPRHSVRRRLIQLYAALLYNANLRGFLRGEIYTGPLKNACVPGLNCYSCPGSIGACPLGALQNALASSGHRAPWYVMGILMLCGLILGRTVCGWLCPMGLLQELLHKLPTPKLKKSPVTRALTWVKYGILVLFVIALPLYSDLPLPAFCKYICPAGTLEGAIGLLANPENGEMFSMLGILFTRKFILLVSIVAGCVFLYRGFCRFLCPLGAIYGLFSRLSLVGITVDTPKCVGCGRCVSICRMDIRRVGDRECIHCGECVKVCPTEAIRWHPAPLRPGKRQRICSVLSRICAAAVLIGVLLSVNRPSPVSETADVSVGSEIGMLCPDFEVPLYRSEDTFRLSEAIGKPVVINFWATWCSPCVGELPCFQQISDLLGDQVTVIAIHSVLVTEDVEAFLNRQEYAFPIGQDQSLSGNPMGSDTVIASLGGSTMLPMTVILDRNGCIVYNQVGSVTAELLQGLIEPLL